MRRVLSAVTIAAALVACPRSPPVRPPLPPPPAGHIKIGSGVIDGHQWTAYRTKEEGQTCIAYIDATDRTGGSACTMELPISFVKTTMWIVPTLKTARTVRLEFPSGPPATAAVVPTGDDWPVDHAFLKFSINDYPSAIVELDAAGRETRRIPCSTTSGCRRN